MMRLALPTEPRGPAKEKGSSRNCGTGHGRPELVEGGPQLESGIPGSPRFARDDVGEASPLSAVELRPCPPLADDTGTGNAAGRFSRHPAFPRSTKRKGGGTLGRYHGRRVKFGLPFFLSD